MKETWQQRISKVARAHSLLSAGSVKNRNPMDRKRDTVLLRAVGPNSICSDCVFFDIKNGERGANLECDRFHVIHNLYADTPLGQKPQCADHRVMVSKEDAKISEKV